MASRDHEDRDWDGWQRDRGGDDRQARGGRDFGQTYNQGGGGQWGQSDDRSVRDERRDPSAGSAGGQGGFGAGTFGGQRGSYVAQGGPALSRGGMSQSGGDDGRDFGRDRGEQGSLGRGSMGGVNFRDEGRDGGRGRQAQADMGYDNFGGGAFRQAAEFAASRSDQGRGSEERFGGSRGAMGGAFGSGDRDYGDTRTDRDRSLLGELASMLGFGSGGARGDQGQVQRGTPGQGYGQGGSPGAGPGYGQGMGPGSGQAGQRRGLGPRKYVRSDARIEEDVNEHLSHGHLDATDVEVAVKDGEVTLSGTVRSRGDKRLAEDIAHDISGVRHVQNNLRVQDNWTAGGMTPGMGGGQGVSQAAPQGAPQGASMGSVLGSSGSASNVTTGQDASQMAGQSPGQSSAESGSLGTSQAGSQSSKPEPNRF